MDTRMDDSSISYFSCNKIRESTFGPLQIRWHEYKGQISIILWNTFTIVVKDIQNLDETQNIHHPDFSIREVCHLNNIFLCIDCDNCLYFSVLRSNESDGKALENIKFKLILENVYEVTHDDRAIYVLVRKDNENFLHTYDILGKSKMKRSKSFKIDLCLPELSNGLYYFNIHVKSARYFSVDVLEKVFVLKSSQTTADSKIFIVSMGDTAYWTVLSDEMENSFSILYTCPAPIESIHFEKQLCTKIYMSLTTGSMLILSCDLKKRILDVETVHLNCSPKRMIFHNNNGFIYTDGLKLWHTAVNITVEEPLVEHRCIKIFNPFDFVYCDANNKMYCSTLQNNLYCFHVDLTECSSTDDKTNAQFIPVPTNLEESHKVFAEILKEQKNTEKVMQSIVDETNLITAIALTRKSDLIIEYIMSSVKVYDDISNIEKDIDVLYIYNRQEYFKKSTQIYVASFEMLKQFKDKFNDMKKAIDNLWHLDVKLHSNKYHSAHSAAVKMKNSNNIKIAIPITTDEITYPVIVEIKLIALIPSIHNKDQYFWCILPTKSFTIDANYFMKIPSENPPLKPFYSNSEGCDLSNRIISIAKRNSSAICDINIPEKPSKNIKFSYYLRLPEMYKEYIKEFSQLFVAHINSANRDAICFKINELLTNDILQVNLTVLDDIVELSVHRKDSASVFKVSSKNNVASWDLYVSALTIWKSILNDRRLENNRTIPHFDYMILQNLREVIKSHLDSNELDLETLLRISEEFYRDIFGILPL